MRTLTKIAAAAAVSLSVSAIAVSANASTVFAFNGNLTSFTWTNNGAGDTGTGGTLVGSGATTLSFQNLTPALDALTGLSTSLSFSGTAVNSPATQPGPTWLQTGLDGSFTYTYSGPNTTIGSISLTTGENLLTGVFTDAWIQGAGGTGSTNVTLGNGGTLAFSSAVTGFTAALPTGAGEFAYSLIGVTPNFGANPGAALIGFQGSALGSFDVVPEPATWAFMILGFGGAGALLRQRRRVSALAA